MNSSNSRRIKCEYNETIKIKPIFDIHYGHKLCDVKAFINYLKDSDENTYFIGGGDLLDSIVVQDFRYRKSMDASETENIMNEQVSDLCDILSPYKDKVLSLGCLSEDTKVLTENGWKFYDEIKEGEQVLSFNIEKNILEYKKIKKIISYKYNDYLYNLKGVVQDQLVTPDHAVLYKKSKGQHIKKEENIKFTYDIPSKLKANAISIPTKGEYKQGTVSVNPSFASLIGWIITEGGFVKGCDGIVITQSTKHQEFIDEIFKLLDNLGYEYTSKIKKHSGDRTKEVPWIAIYIKSKYGTEIKKVIHNKNITREILNTWDYDSLCILKDAMLRGDGVTHYNKKEYKGKKYFHKTTTYYTSNKELADNFTELCLKTNTPVSVRFRERQQLYKGYEKPIQTSTYEISILSNTKDKKINTIEKVLYTGTVFDLMVEDNFNFVCIRKGKPFITGNCGNHEKTIVRKSSYNPMLDICKRLEIPYAGISWIYTLRLRGKDGGGRTIYIRGHHGWGGGSRTQGADLTKFSKDTNYYDCDLFLYGHVHRKQFDEIPRLSIVGNKLIAKPKKLVICGTFQKTMSDNSDDSWSEEQGFPPVAIGGVDIYITPKPNSWVDIKVDI